MIQIKIHQKNLRIILVIIVFPILSLTQIVNAPIHIIVKEINTQIIFSRS
jgi:hypothetical protein